MKTKHKKLMKILKYLKTREISCKTFILEANVRIMEEVDLFKTLCSKNKYIITSLNKYSNPEL